MFSKRSVDSLLMYTKQIMCILFCVLYFDCTNIISHALGILLQPLQDIKREKKMCVSAVVNGIR